MTVQLKKPWRESSNPNSRPLSEAELKKVMTPVPQNQEDVGIGLLDLTATTCRYIIGGEGVSARFCGAKIAKGNYCDFHYPRMYTPVPKPKKKRVRYRK